MYFSRCTILRDRKSTSTSRKSRTWKFWWCLRIKALFIRPPNISSRRYWKNQRSSIQKPSWSSSTALQSTLSTRRSPRWEACLNDQKQHFILDFSGADVDHRGLAAEREKTLLLELETWCLPHCNETQQSVFWPLQEFPKPLWLNRPVEGERSSGRNQGRWQLGLVVVIFMHTCDKM